MTTAWTLVVFLTITPYTTHPNSLVVPNFADRPACELAAAQIRAEIRNQKMSSFNFWCFEVVK
jgi:hypothetical protein